MSSLHQRLAWGLAAVVTCLVLMGGWIACRAVAEVLTLQFDEALLAKLRTLTSLADDTRRGIRLEFTERPLPEYVRADRPEYYQVWLSDSTALARSPSLGTNDLIAFESFSTVPRHRPLLLPDGRPGRVVIAGFDLGRETSRAPDFAVIVALARDTQELDRAVRRVVAGTILGAGALLALAAALVHIVTRVSLSPVARLARAVEGIDARSLTRRVPIDTGPRELVPVVEQLNRLLDRLESAFERERRFSANVAHELLTPVAELRAVSENALRWRDDPEATRHLAADVLETSSQLDRLVHTLLSIARHERHEVPLEFERIDLVALLGSVREEHAARMASRDLVLEWDLPTRVMVSADASVCRSILHNLLANATEHTPKGGHVKCRLESIDNAFRLHLENTNPGLVSADLQRLTEPFWRKDPARGERAHAGLGLALVAVLVSTLRWHFETKINSAGFFVATLSGPTQPDPSPAKIEGRP